MKTTDSNIRALVAADMEQAVALDAEVGEIARRDFFHRRWKAMEAGPESYIALVAGQPDAVHGLVMGHILAGEFGTRRRAAVIDSIAVSAERRASGLGKALMEAFKTVARERGCNEIRTLAEWRRPDLLGFFAASGFSLAPLNVLEKTLADNRGGGPHAE